MLYFKGSKASDPSMPFEPTPLQRYNDYKAVCIDSGYKIVVDEFIDLGDNCEITVIGEKLL